MEITYISKIQGIGTDSSNIYTIKDAEAIQSIATGDSNGQIKITPRAGNAYNVDVKGLGSNAYTSTAYLPLTGGTMTGQIKTSFKSSVAMGTYCSSQTTIPNLIEEVRYSSGCGGSVNITEAYTLNNITISASWYNFLYIPHRSGGVNGEANGDNCNYGILYLHKMNGADYQNYAISFSSSTIQKVTLTANFKTAITSGQVLISDGTTGSIKTSGYTIATSVPSGAVFTDTKVTQNNTTTNSDYRILLSTSANDNAETNTINKNTNLRYNPSTKVLSVGGSVSAIGNLSVTGTSTLSGETSAQSLTAGSLLVTGNASFTQIPTAPTPATGSNDTSVATTAFVKNNLGGLSGAMHFKGTTTTALSDGTTTAAITISGSSYTPNVGDVVLYSDKEFVWTGSLWEMLGAESSFKVVQTAVVDTAYTGSDTATTFVSAVTQDSNGNIEVTKRKLPTYNNYSHPTGDGNLHVPATGTNNNGKFLQAGSTAGSLSWAALPTASSSTAGIMKLGADDGAATYGHTHAISLATDTGTSTITLESAGKYKLTAGGTSVIFTMPTSNNYSHPTTTAVDAAAVKVGKDNLGHVVLGSALTNADVGLSNVENTKLSTWTGSSNITTIGTLSSGTVPWARLSNVPSSFTPSSHTHNLLVTEGDNRTVATTPNDYSNKIIFRGLKTNSSFNSPSTDTYSYVIGLRGWSDSSGGDSHELAFNNTGLYWRHGATTSWGNWARIYTTANKPTKSDVGLGNVENTALSTWAGSGSITTIGTLSSGTVPWARLSNVPSSFTPSAHTHYWANIATTSAAAYNTAPEMATLKLNGNTSATTASTSNVTLVFDATTQALNFVFA